MKLLSTIVCALSTVDHVFSAVIPHESSVIQKRQWLNNLLGIPSDLSLLALLNSKTRRDVSDLVDAMQHGRLGHLMGEENATSILQSYAKALGAIRDNPGGFMKTNLDLGYKGYGIVAVPEEAKSVPVKSMVATHSSRSDARAVKIRYGPYKVPAANAVNFYGEYGMLSNFPHTGLAKPCDGDCTILGFRAGLEYPDGTNANIDTGMWLHHGVLYTVGPNRREISCSDMDISIPHISINSTAFHSERIYTFGDERTEINFEKLQATDIGVEIRGTDSFAAVMELMNENPVDKIVYVTLTYDIVDGHPFKDNAAAVWHDIRNCGTVSDDEEHKPRETSLTDCLIEPSKSARQVSQSLS